MIVGDSGAAVYSIVVEDVVLNLEAIDDAGRCFFFSRLMLITHKIQQSL